MGYEVSIYHADLKKKWPGVTGRPNRLWREGGWVCEDGQWSLSDLLPITDLGWVHPRVQVNFSNPPRREIKIMTACRRFTSAVLLLIDSPPIGIIRRFTYWSYVSLFHVVLVVYFIFFFSRIFVYFPIIYIPSFLYFVWFFFFFLHSFSWLFLSVAYQSFLPFILFIDLFYSLSTLMLLLMTHYLFPLLLIPSVFFFPKNNYFTY